MKWDPQKQDWVEEYDPGPPEHEEDAGRPGLILILGFMFFALFAVVMLFKFVGEGPGPGAPVSPGPRPTGETGLSPSPAPLGGLPVENWDSVADSVLRAYLEGGADQAAFVVNDVQTMTGCAVAEGRLGLIDGVRAEFRQDVARVRRTYEYTGVATERTEDGLAALLLGVECP